MNRTSMMKVLLINIFQTYQLLKKHQFQNNLVYKTMFLNKLISNYTVKNKKLTTKIRQIIRKKINKVTISKNNKNYKL